MKKTLITLAALAAASASYATTIDDAIVNTTDISDRIWAGGTDHNSSTKTDSYTWIAVMDWDTAVSTLGDWQNKSNIYATDNQNVYAAVGLRFFHDSTTIKTMLCEHKDTSNYSSEKWFNNYSYTTSGLTVAGDGSSVGFDEATFENTGKLVLSFSYDDSDKTFTLGALKADGTLGTISLDMSKVVGWNPNSYNGVDLTNKAANTIEHFMWFGSALSTEDITSIATAVVPEPATATLSLLALAGLAARRRRQA